MKQADLVIVGAGAAGLIASIAAGRMSAEASVADRTKKPLRIELLDSRAKIGAKILISGGTRCNVTNRAVSATDYNGATAPFIRHTLSAFTPARTIGFFAEIGVPLVLEPTGKYFPATHSGRTVLDALVKESARAGARLVTDARVDGLEKMGDAFFVKAGGGGWKAPRVILATGGLSLPETGSDGMGLRIAESLGHTIVPTVPALTPLTSGDRDWQELSGVTLSEVKLSFYAGGKKRAESKGGFLFTHFGFSGPAPLDISRHFARAPKDSKPFVEADFTPSEKELPSRFLKTLKLKNGTLARYVLPVTGVYGYKKAEATAGGVDVSEVKQPTMESKIVPGLHFCGEILDVDGRIGGFNFQWAWSSGWIAGSAAAKALA